MKKYLSVLMISALFKSAIIWNSIKSVDIKEFGNVSFIFDEPTFYEISYGEMLEDLDYLEYLFTSSYTGYDDMVSRGFDFSVLKNNIKENLQETSVNSRDFLNNLYDEFEPYLNDSHFGIRVEFQEADLFSNEMIYKEIETEKSVYIRISSFFQPADNDENKEISDEAFRKYIECGIKYKDKENIILDLRGNPDGNSEYSNQFFRNLYGMSKKKVFFNKNIYEYSTFLVSRSIFEAFDFYCRFHKNDKDVKSFLDKIKKIYKQGKKIYIENPPVKFTKKINPEYIRKSFYDPVKNSV